jgi:hypothetical protein
MVVRFMSRGWGAVVMAVVVGWAAPARAQRVRPPVGEYTLRDFGPVATVFGSRLNGAGSWAGSCHKQNAADQACGFYNQGNPPNNLRYDEPTTTFVASQAQGINGAGFSVGQASTATAMTAALWSGPVFMGSLPPLSGFAVSRARDINDYGLIVGLSTGNGSSLATRWTSSGVASNLTVTWPARARFSSSEATATNSRNTTAGTFVAPERQNNLTAWVMTAAGVFSDDLASTLRASQSTDLNDSDVVVGFGTTFGGLARGWAGGAGQSLVQLPPLPGGGGSAAFGINNSLVVAGFSSGGDGLRAVLWSLTTPGAVTPADLNGKVGLTLYSYRLTAAVAINDAGQILCEGFITSSPWGGGGDPQGVVRAIVLTPRQ